MRGLFITGTDTGVGKTVVTAAIARILTGQGVRVAVCKPVATGAQRVGETWLSDDTRQLAEAAGVDSRSVTRWAFPEAVAPPVAARCHSVTISLREIVEFVAGQRADITLVEGIGGLLCPLTDTETVADLATQLGLPLLVVARRSLGTLNHTLMTLEMARSRKLPVAGIVVNETTPVQGLAEETNVEELRRHCVEPVLAVTPHEPQMLRIQSVLAGIDWLKLCDQQKSM